MRFSFSRIYIINLQLGHYIDLCMSLNINLFPEPPAPTDCHFDDVTSSGMYIEWVEPDGDICDIKDYRLTWEWVSLWMGEQGAGNETVAVRIPPHETIIDLMPETDYTFHISASTDGGYGPPLNCSQATAPGSK